MRGALLLGACLIGVLAAAPVRAQQPLDDPRLSAVRGSIAAALADAEREGLPSEWLLAKVREGLSKRVPPPRIAAAVGQLLSRMRDADAMVAPVAPERGPQRRQLLRAAVDALNVGAPSAGLGQLVREASPRGAAHVREVLVAVAELGERGFGAPAAVEAVREARRGAGVAPLIERARRLGPSGRDDALRETGRELGRGRGLDHPGRGRDHDSHGPPGRTR
ncbi:MAG: hypothetical protein IT378_07575 [Sandaracinaceae bacterium]|nr:hypothetical protein [Sandaracinaceae bacterium]